MSNVIIPQFEEIEQLFISIDKPWKQRSMEASKQKKALDVFRAIWDNNNAEYMGSPYDNKEIIRILSERLGEHDRSIKSLYPWGYFRGLFTKEDTHETIYNKLTRRAHEPIGGSSIYEVAMEVAMKNRMNEGLRYVADQIKYRNEFRYTDFHNAFYLMIYRSGMGIAYENEVVKWFKNKTEAGSGTWKAVEASGDLEKEDIDLILKKNCGAQINVSIKCFGAYSDRTIEEKRRKGKTKPHLYAGVKSVVDRKIHISTYENGSRKDLNNFAELGIFLDSFA